MVGPSTTAVHGRIPARDGDPTGALEVPVHRASTFRYPELHDGGASPYIYSRYANPTVDAVQARLAALEGAAGALLFSSGLAAVTAVCTSLVRPGHAMAVQQGVYGGTMALLREELEPRGIKVRVIDCVAPPRQLPPDTDLVWMESITNPLLRVADVGAWADAAHRQDARLAVDATFATPLLQRPLSVGADVVVHSATKYLGGHSDLIAGVAATDDAELQKALWTRRRNLGSPLDAEVAWLLQRGVKTLAVRLRAQQENALALARAAEEHPAVQAVHHPGLASHPDHATAQRLLKGAGAMVTLDLGSREKAVRFRRLVQVMTPAASLGGVESLVSLPMETSHAYASEEQRRRDGVTDGLVRISVGIEDKADLLEDLERALG